MNDILQILVYFHIKDNNFNALLEAVFRYQDFPLLVLSSPLVLSSSIDFLLEFLLQVQGRKSPGKFPFTFASEYAAETLRVS